MRLRISGGVECECVSHDGALCRYMGMLWLEGVCVYHCALIHSCDGNSYGRPLCAAYTKYRPTLRMDIFASVSIQEMEQSLAFIGSSRKKGCTPR